MAQDEDFRKKVEAILFFRIGKEAQRGWLRKQLAVLDEEIVRLDLYYAQICNERSPIFALPNELLLAIFEYAYYSTRFSLPDIQGTDCCDEEREHDAHRECQGCISVEMDISQVCRSWRALALGCPEFWSTFNFRGREWDFEDLRLPMYLERSRERPLDIRLDVPADLHDEIPSMITMLLPHAARWRHFSLRYDGRKDPAAFFDSINPISAGNLETLEISTYTEPSEEWELRRCRVLAGTLSKFKAGAAPKLTSLRVDSSIWEPCLPLVSNLTVLQIDGPYNGGGNAMTLETFIDILQLPTLASLSIEEIEIETYPMPLHPIVAPNLRHFRCSKQELFSSIWQHLKAPLLELLIIGSAYISGDWEVPIENPGDGSKYEHFPSLTTLSFINCAVVGNSTFTGLAQATPSVAHLIICHGIEEYGTDDRDAFLHMVKYGGDTIYWPNLKTVSYSPWEKLPPEDKFSTKVVQFTDMLAHRAVTLQTHCTYQIWDPDLNRLMHADGHAGDLWRSIKKGKFHDIVPKDVEDPMDWSPWPARLNIEFHSSSELPFHPYFSDRIWDD